VPANSNPQILPLTPFDPEVRTLADSFAKVGELLPLLLYAHQEGSSRTAAALWLGQNGPVEVMNFRQLQVLLADWDGAPPEARQVQDAMALARSAAEQRAKDRNQQWQCRYATALARQLSSAKLRLQRELGRYLASWALSGNNLQGVLEQLLQLERGSSDRIRRCLERLGGRVPWSVDQSRDLDIWVRSLPEAKRQARLLGSELDAALRDPRWAAQLVPFR
jgi:hypothetical protein